VKTVFNIIKHAPPWQPEWDTEEWKTEIKRIIQEHYENNNEPKQDFLSW